MTTTTEHTATLNEGQEYYLVVRAYNDYGESGNSNEVKWPSDSVDSESPNTFGHVPAKDATDVSSDTNIVVRVQDSGDGVDQSSLVMKVDGETVQPLISGSPADYTLTYDPSTDFNYGQVVTVEIDAQDLHDPPNVMNHDSCTFTIVNSRSSGTYTKVFGDASGADCPGTIQDTFINLNDGNSVRSESLNTYTWPTNQVANAIILKADLAAIPYGAQVQSATLHLYMNSMGGDDLYDISVHKIINYNPNLSQCSGYTYDGTNSWTPNGGCYDDIPLAQSDIAAEEDVKSIDKTYGYKTWDVTDMVRDWIANPSMNFGLLLNSDTSASSGSNRFFASSEASDPNQRPKLVVTYITGSEVNVPPTIGSFTTTPSSLNNPGETTTFNVSATDPDGDSLTYTVNFGDGTANGSGSQAVHTYETEGTYTAEVTVDDGHGNTVGESLQITVDDIPPDKPTGVTAK